jgi:SAM-dependent methyltransferase
MDIVGLLPEEVATRATRRALAHTFIRGEGIEVGGGNRPVLLPEGVKCHYGDIRGAEALEAYFKEKIPVPSFLDAQTLVGVADDTLDFVISAHVIEHLPDALGSARNSLRVLKKGGIFFLALPDKRFTFDQNRPVTSLAHVIGDEKDGGKSTMLDAYKEWAVICHDWGSSKPTEEQIDQQARAWLPENADLHFHVWDDLAFRAMIAHICDNMGAEALAIVPVMNENIAILRKMSFR